MDKLLNLIVLLKSISKIIMLKHDLMLSEKRISGNLQASELKKNQILFTQSMEVFRETSFHGLG